MTEQDAHWYKDAILYELHVRAFYDVDGLRLDAVPYLYEREGTSSENLPKTHQFLQKLRRYIDRRFPQRMLLAEANQWPEDACAYLGQGEECHMAFHFPLMPRLFMAIHLEDRLPIVDIMAQTPPIPESCQWALFLRNHDELTLEMVTDQAINVASQQDNQESLLWWMKRLIALRKRYQAFGRGSLELLNPANPGILAFTRRYRDEVLLVVAHLSRFVQHTSLDLAAFQSRVPVELYGRVAFPVLGRKPLFLTLAPHGFYWFALESRPTGLRCSAAVAPEDAVPILTPDCCTALLQILAGGNDLDNDNGMQAWTTKAYKRLRGSDDNRLTCIEPQCSDALRAEREVNL